MKIIINNYEQIKNKTPLTITIGNFDGIHLGHQALINKTLSFTDSKSAVLSFYPHPKKVLTDVDFKQLMSLEQKLNALKPFKLDYTFIVNFTQDFANISPLEFINFLKELTVKRIIIGKDFRFGKFAKGNISDLKKHFKVVLIDDLVENQVRISTSYIKNLLIEGKLNKASSLLNRNYQIEGIVIDGDKVGKTLGFPTANLAVDSYVLPPNGVYFVKVDINNKIYGGALNIGYNPTINYQVNKRVEVHILDFNEQIYGKKIKLTFINFLRKELKFKNKEELIKTMTADVKKCRHLFKNN